MSVLISYNLSKSLPTIPSMNVRDDETTSDEKGIAERSGTMKFGDDSFSFALLISRALFHVSLTCYVHAI